MNIFGDETITVPTASPEGQEAETAVETQEQPGTQQQESQSEQPSGTETSEEGKPSAETAEQGEMLLGKFKSVDDLTKAYKNLERSFHESRQPSRQPAPPQTTAAPHVDTEDPREIVARAFETDPIGTIQYFVDQRLAPVQEQRETEALSRNFESISKQYAKQLGTDEGVKAYFDKVAEIAGDFGNPALIRNPSPRVLRMAAEELWGGETRQQVYNQAKNAARVEAETARLNKQGLNAPTGAKPKEQPKTEADRIKEGILGASKGGGLFG